MKKPRALAKGDTIGIIAPSGVVDPSELSGGIRRLESLGYRVLAGRNVLNSRRYLAGTDEERARDLQEMILDPQVKAVFCARGGYGAARLLSRIDRASLAAHPKILVGSSDATVLLLYWIGALGQVCFHGPMVAPYFGRKASSADTEDMVRVLSGGDWEPLRFGGLETYRKGTAEAPLIGGCLSILCSLLGTSFAPETRGAVVFLEDVNESPYRIDRMLTQLRLAGQLDGVRGIVFGKMIGCDPGSDAGYTLKEVILDVLGDLKCPVVYGLPAGHGEKQVTLPLGTRVRLDANRGELILLEPGVSDERNSG